MNDRKRFAELLERQEKIEKSAVKKYPEYLDVLNEDMSKKVEEIIEEEKEHVDIVKEMKDIFESYGGKFESESSELLNLSESDLNSAMIVVSPVENYMYKIINFIRSVSDIRNIGYLSYNKVPSMIKNELELNDFDVSKIEFLSCTSTRGPENINPKSLTDISLGLKKELKKDNVLVLVDSITSFTSNHSEKAIRNFVSSINDFARTEDREVLWVAVDTEKNRELINSLVQLCDRKLEF